MQGCSYASQLKIAVEKLKNSHEETNPAFLAMEDLFGMNRTRLMIDGEIEMPEAERQMLHKVIDEVCSGKPYQYVIGFSWFYGEKFKVNENVLIPRNETEELVQLVLKETADDGKTAADIGTGTGIIPIILGKHWTYNRLFAVDISEEALDVARENNHLHNTKTVLLKGDLFEPLIEQGIRVDVLISNPPYISCDETDYMSRSTLEYEPAVALYAGDSGLALYKKMINDLPKVMNDRGKVYFEIGFRQGEALRDYIVSIWPNTVPEIENDINGNPRILHFMWER